MEQTTIFNPVQQHLLKMFGISPLQRKVLTH